VSRRGTELLVEASVADFPAFHIDPHHLNDLIETHGTPCELRKAVWCPCRRIETAKPRAGCPHCRGLGFCYPEDMREHVIAFVLNRMPRRNMVAAVGEIVTGTVTITFPLGFLPGQGDMLFPEGEEQVIHETIWRAEKQVEDRKVRARAEDVRTLAPRQRPADDTLLYPAVHEVEHLHWIAAGKLRRGTMADFTVKGNRVVWTKGRGPEAGGAYVVRYRAPAAYVVRPAEPLYRAEGTSGYPYRVEGQRLDKYGVPDLR